MFSIGSVSKAGWFKSTYQILVCFHVLLKCLPKADWFKSTYQILGCSSFCICLIPLLDVSLHSINQTLKRSLDIDDLPHGPLLNLIVSIKSYYDSIAQWTKTYNYLSFPGQSLFYLLATSHLWNSLHLKFSTSSSNHAKPSKKQTKPLAFITSLISLPKTSKTNPSLHLLERSLSGFRKARS